MLRCAVVEDEILIRRNMVKKIKACGADIEVVCEAGNGRDALAYIRKREVDLVVTDIQMPIPIWKFHRKSISKVDWMKSRELPGR